MLNPEAVEPLNAQLAAILRERIRSGELPAGARLPSERVMAEEFDVSRPTVRSAINKLMTEGLVVTGITGAGTRVRTYDPVVYNLTDLEGPGRRDDPALGDDWAQHVRAAGREPSEEIVRVALVQPSRPAARALGLGDGPDQVALVRFRRRRVDGLVIGSADSAFPTWLLSEPGGDVLLEEGSVTAQGGVLAAIGFPMVRKTYRISSRMPTPEEITLLQLASATPVLQLVRVGYAPDGRPVSAMVCVFASDRAELEAEIG